MKKTERANSIANALTREVINGFPIFNILSKKY